jgi:putative acetyltransferase
MDAARQAGYACILLDTLDDMEPPVPCMTNWGSRTFRPTITTPFPGAHYLRASL